MDNGQWIMDNEVHYIKTLSYSFNLSRELKKQKTNQPY